MTNEIRPHLFSLHNNILFYIENCQKFDCQQLIFKNNQKMSTLTKLVSKQVWQYKFGTQETKYLYYHRAKQELPMHGNF